MTAEMALQSDPTQTDDPATVTIGTHSNLAFVLLGILDDGHGVFILVS